MTTTPPPPPSDETPEELDEFLARRVRRALSVVPTPDEGRRDRQLAAALAAFDDASEIDSTTGTRVGRQRRAWWPTASAAAVALLIGVGVLAIANNGSGSDDADTATAATDSAEASRSEASDSDKLAPVSPDSHPGADETGGAGESIIVESAEQFDGSTADATAAAPASPAARSATPVDLGRFESFEALADTLRSRLADRQQDDGTDAQANAATSVPGGAVPEDVAPNAAATSGDVDAGPLSSPPSGGHCLAERPGDAERFSALVAGVRYLVEIDPTSRRVVAVDLLTCHETELLVS
ncbi:MAG: hypothetical protein GX868_07820 [Actinobacteria bacterium]|nr:hypothetical protein [Actinomycetota bacterium]